MGELDADALEAAGVPRLSTVLAALDGAWLDVELKGDDHGDATAAVLRAARGEAPANAVVSSFDAPSLAAMATVLPGWGRWLNAVDLAPATLSLALGLGCRAVAVLWGAITPASVRRAQRRRAGGRGVDRAADGDAGPARAAGRRRVLRRGRGAGSRAA